MYIDVIKDTKVKNEEKLSYKEFKKLIEVAKRNRRIAENMCMKIQGLKIMHFFIKNKKDVSTIMNKMINVIKKISLITDFLLRYTRDKVL